MAECLDPIALENLDVCPGGENLPGVVETEVYVAALSDFDTIEALPDAATATDLDTYGTIATAHVMKVDRGFHRIQLRVDTGLVDGAQVGSKGGLSIQNSFTGVLPKNDGRTVGWVRKYLNVPVIVLARERTGLLKQIGSKNSPAYIMEVTPSSGTVPGDPVGTTLKITDTQSQPAPVYSGTVQEFPAPTIP